MKTEVQKAWNVSDFFPNGPANATEQFTIALVATRGKKSFLSRVVNTVRLFMLSRKLRLTDAEFLSAVDETRKIFRAMGD